jgi:uncharacterized protein (DUF1697 family)
MTRHAALLRGVNVGRAKRVAMADLRKLVESLGARDVRTLLNSGNVVFTLPKGDAGAFASRLEDGLANKLGVTASVTTIAAADLAAIVKANPLRGADEAPSRFLVSFFRRPADRAKLTPLARRPWDPDELAVGPRAAYVRCSSGLLESKLAAAVGKALGDGVTSRNWATVLKLSALASDA